MSWKWTVPVSDLVPAAEIERIVGISRHPTEHYGRAVSTEQSVYILHSQECKDSGRDRRECPYSQALDEGIESGEWPEDEPVRLAVDDGFLLAALDGPGE